MADWQHLYQSGGDRMEMLQVADGYILRNWVQQGSGAHQMGLVFIAGALPAAPVVVDTPAVYPDPAKPGDMLTCTMGNWQGVPLEYEYCWKSDADPAEVLGYGANYAVLAEDAGHAITCTVLARNAGGETEVTSNPVTVAAE